MNPLTQLIKEDMIPALGVTEPGSIAYISALARSYTVGRIVAVNLSLSSSVYKGAFTCGIPGTEDVGIQFAAALGLCGGDHTKGLQALEGLTDQAIQDAREMVNEGKIHAKIHSITSDIYLHIKLETIIDTCEVTIKGSHTNVTEIIVNGKPAFSKELDLFRDFGEDFRDRTAKDLPDQEASSEDSLQSQQQEPGEENPDTLQAQAYDEETPEDQAAQEDQALPADEIRPLAIEDENREGAVLSQPEEVRPQEEAPSAEYFPSQAASAPSHYPQIRGYTLADFVEYANTVELSEIAFIRSAYDMNLALLEEGMNSERTHFSKQLFKRNGGAAISEDEVATAQFLTNTALEARVIGLSRPAMSITGSGAHGILCTMPLYACCAVHKLTEEKLLRATALSYLITIYIKEYSGLLSAFCGCAIAAGTGAAVGLCYLADGTVEEMGRVINNMASSITGMICDGGNAGCTMKGITAVDAAYRAVTMAMNEAWIDSAHGICGPSAEQTLRNMGQIAYPGMRDTEKTILDILAQKDKAKGFEEIPIAEAHQSAPEKPANRRSSKKSIFHRFKKGSSEE